MKNHYLFSSGIFPAKLFGTLAASLLYSCSTPESATVQPVTVVEGEPVPDTVLFGEQRIVFLSADSCMIDDIARIAVCDGRFYLLDRVGKSLQAYDRSGRCVASVRAVGRGPNEYTFPMDFCLDRQSKQIILFADPNKFLYYDCDLKFLRAVEAPYFLDEMVDDGERIVCYARPDQADHCVSLLDKKSGKFSPVESSVLLDQPESNAISNPGRQLTKSRRINFTKLFDNSIYSIDDGKATLRYRIDFGKRNLPADLAEAKLSMAEFLQKAVSNHYIYAIGNITENDSDIYFNTSSFGIYRLSKKDATVTSVPYMTESGTGAFLGAMIPVDDGSGGEWLCFSKSMIDLKKEIQFPQNRDRRGELIDRINRADESDNPVLFFYRTK